MTLETKKECYEALMSQRQEKVVVRTSVAPRLEVLKSLKTCIHAIFAGHWTVASTSFTSAITTFYRCYRTPIEGEHRKN